MKPLRFEIALTVLDHLGRNLYRSFATILGEAISNAWDAEAENVQIVYDPAKRNMCIADDGTGMSRDDLQNRFLKIGYSKRDEFGTHSPNKKRHHIGRKGIGKLALLSCADRVVVLSKTTAGKWNGVVIDNSEINAEIKKGSGTADYELKEPDFSAYKELCSADRGTVICFEGLKEERSHTEEFLRKIIALYFRFSLIDPEFKIVLNNTEVTIDALSELASNTEFVWNINNYDSDPFLPLITPANGSMIGLTTDSVEISGFIASVKKPTNRNIFGAKERIGVDLFVNGRMRELDIMKHSPSSQLPEEYIYGQIHIDSLDSGENDPFTSSREGVQVDDPIYKKYLAEIKILVIKVLDQWDDLREMRGEDGDPDNTKRESSKMKKAKSLYREVAKDYTGEDDGINGGDKFIRDLANDAAFNSSSYVQCFISENLLRRHIGDNGPTACLNKDRSDGDKTCIDRYDKKAGNTSLCVYCKGEDRKKGLQDQKTEAGISIPIRSAEENLLMYLDYIDLARVIDDKILRDEDTPYKPLRNSVMHTSRLTEEAKTKLTSVFDNVVATVKNLVVGGSKKS
ncbi:MAG: ATP-binding protein [Candidatus Paceibacterota bacterium]|jgi:hypothetical protein